jgi:hypothetical protein
MDAYLPSRTREQRGTQIEERTLLLELLSASAMTRGTLSVWYADCVCLLMVI